MGYLPLVQQLGSFAGRTALRGHGPKVINIVDNLCGQPSRDPLRIAQTSARSRGFGHTFESSEVHA